MKKILFTIAFAIVSSITFAQGTLGAGNLQANGGLGFSGWGIPVHAGVDYGINDEITVGGEVALLLGKVNAAGFLANGNYHFNKLLEIPSEFDVYGGVSLGFHSNLSFTGQIGGRYFFTDQMGVHLEFGAGNITGGKLGITYKF